MQQVNLLAKWMLLENVRKDHLTNYHLMDGYYKERHIFSTVILVCCIRIRSITAYVCQKYQAR